MKRIITPDPLRPDSNVKYEICNYIEWKGTIGVGDSMMGLNTCHMISHLLQTPVHMDVHWYHDKNYLFHCEDPETIVERFEFIQTCYKNSENVIVNHIFNSKDDDLHEQRFRGFQRIDKKRGAVFSGLNSWIFREDLFVPPKENKVVIWKPFKNATPARLWKRSFREKDWRKVENHYLRQKHGYDVVELSYRTPIREAFYHISTCKFVVCYDGMWHYITRNFMKPAVVFGNNGVIKNHNPNAVLFETPTNYEQLFRNKRRLERKLERTAGDYAKKMRGILDV